jgi:hypothetical protein
LERLEKLDLNGKGFGARPKSVEKLQKHGGKTLKLLPMGHN